MNQRQKHIRKKGDREWAYAKNGKGDEHYAKAREAYAKAKEYQEKAEHLRNGG